MVLNRKLSKQVCAMRFRQMDRHLIEDDVIVGKNRWVLKERSSRVYTIKQNQPTISKSSSILRYLFKRNI